MPNSTGSILKKWRKLRRYSQLQLAIELDISSKHICFIETGKSKPSKEMIIRLSHFLLLPKSEINTFLHSAGYAPIYTDLSVTDQSLKPVFEAIDKMIENHMPYPALVLNKDWDIIKTNDAANQLMIALGFQNHNNIIEALISDNPKTSKIIDWHKTVQLILIRLRQEISFLGDSARLQSLEKQLSDCLPATEDQAISDEKIVLSTKFKINNKVLSFFSIIAQLSTVQDITLSEYKVELMFPSDENTKVFYTYT